MCLLMAKAALTLSRSRSQDPLPCLQQIPFNYSALAAGVRYSEHVCPGNQETTREKFCLCCNLLLSQPHGWGVTILQQY